MKQTKKLTRSQREYLQKHCGVDDVSNARLVEETKDHITVQFDGDFTVKYPKEV